MKTYIGVKVVKAVPMKKDGVCYADYGRTDSGVGTMRHPASGVNIR